MSLCSQQILFQALKVKINRAGGTGDHRGAWNHEGTGHAGYHGKTETDRREIIYSLNCHNRELS